MGKIVLFIYGDAVKEALNNAFTLSKQSHVNNILVVGFTDFIAKEAQKLQIASKYFEEYLNEKLLDKIETGSVSWIKEWPDIKIRDNKSFKEMFIYEGVAMWWFAEYAVFYDKEGIFNIVKLIEITKSIFDTEHPEKIVAIKDGSLESGVIGKVVDMYKIPIEWIYLKKSNNLRVFLHNRLRKLARIGFFGATVIFRKYLYGINRLLHKRFSAVATTSKKPKILMVSQHGRFARPYIDAAGKRRIGDLYWGSLEKALVNDRTKDVVNMSTAPPMLRGRLSTLMEFKELISKHISYVPFEFYWDKDIILKMMHARKKFGVEWNKLKHDASFRNSLKYDDIDISDLVENAFSNMFLNSFPNTILHIESMKSAIEKERADIILFYDESYPTGRMFSCAARAKNVPSLGLQHGIINRHLFHINYYHEKEETWYSTPKDDVNKCPIPTKTVVWGGYFKNRLVDEGNYPEESVVVTGCPRYDILYHADNIYDKNQIFKELNSDPNKKVVLWTTQTHGLSLDENLKNISAVYNAMKTLKKVQLVVKLHQSENQRATLYKKDISLKPVIVGGRADTYALLYVCDLMITRHSTTAMEAVALNKPVIIMNLSGEADSVEYVKEGVALGVYMKKDLKPTIEKVLRDETILAKNRENFIKKYLYKIDGKASERVVQLIKEMIKEEWKRDET